MAAEADDDWESKNFDEEELPKAPLKPVRTDKWEGEDEEEPSKDNWDDDDESKPAPAKATEAPKKKKNRLAEAIAEKERKQQEKNRANMTPEELAVEKNPAIKDARRNGITNGQKHVRVNGSRHGGSNDKRRFRCSTEKNSFGHKEIRKATTI